MVEQCAFMELETKQTWLIVSSVHKSMNRCIKEKKKKQKIIDLDQRFLKIRSENLKKSVKASGLVRPNVQKACNS